MVAGTAAVTVAACDLSEAWFDSKNHRVEYTISGEEGDSYYEELYEWDEDFEDWFLFDQGPGYFETGGTKTGYITVSGHGSIKIVVDCYDDVRTSMVVNF